MLPKLRLQHRIVGQQLRSDLTQVEKSIKERDLVGPEREHGRQALLCPLDERAGPPGDLAPRGADPGPQQRKQHLFR